MKKNSIQKNIKNKNISYLLSNCVHNINIKYNEAKIYLAHFVFKDINTFIEKKFIICDRNFLNIFRDILNNKKGKELFEKKKKITDLDHKNSLLSKNLDLDYVETLIRERFLFGKEGETIYIIKKDEN